MSKRRFTVEQRIELGPDPKDAAHTLVVGETFAAARARILREVPYYEEPEVHELMGIQSPNDFARLVGQGTLLILSDHGDSLCPVFQFDQAKRQPYEPIAQVNHLLGAGDGWGVVSWWTRPNSGFMDRQSPQELLGTPSEYAIVQLLENRDLEEW